MQVAEGLKYWDGPFRALMLLKRVERIQKEKYGWVVWVDASALYDRIGL